MSKPFVRVAALQQVAPGKMICVDAPGGRRLLLANVDGVVHATDEMCTHEDAPLCTGSLQGHFVKCPLHGSRFDLITGEPSDDPADQPLVVYPVRIEDRDILVGLSNEQERT